MRPKLIEWHRDKFAVDLEADPIGLTPRRAELTVGIVSGPFGIYPGTRWSVGHETPGRKRWTLVHMATQLAQFTLPREGLCRQAATELAECDLAWESAWVLGVVGPIPELEKARDIHLKWRRWERKR